MPSTKTIPVLIMTHPLPLLHAWLFKYKPEIGVDSIGVCVNIAREHTELKPLSPI